VPADGPRDYEIGYKKPPVATRFKLGNRANPSGRPRGSKNLATLLERALDMPADADASEHPGRLTKRDLVVARLVQRSAGADLAATKLLFELLRKVDPNAAAATAESADFTPDDEKVIEGLKARLLNIARAEAANPPPHDPPNADPRPAAPDTTDPDDGSAGKR
jgi:Family of unknown function (DUF5681)